MHHTLSTVQRKGVTEEFKEEGTERARLCRTDAKSHSSQRNTPTYLQLEVAFACVKPSHVERGGIAADKS